jgi:hypothetical protein
MQFLYIEANSPLYGNMILMCLKKILVGYEAKLTNSVCFIRSKETKSGFFFREKQNHVVFEANFSSAKCKVK